MSLVEVMVVIAIVLTLTAVLGAGVLHMWRKARVDVTQLTLARAGEAVLVHEARKGAVPSGLQEVYGEEPVPRDAWGTELVWERPEGTWDIVSWGEDAAAGGTGFAADLHYR